MLASYVLFFGGIVGLVVVVGVLSSIADSVENYFNK